ATLFVDRGLVDGAVPCLRYDTRAQHAYRRRRTLSPILPMALVRGQAYPPSAHSPAHAAQPTDRGEPDRGLQRTELARACSAGRHPTPARFAARRTVGACLMGGLVCDATPKFPGRCGAKVQ